jgi:hypothetical protein
MKTEALSLQDFESLYDAYSPMLYGIAVKISQTQEEAEGILNSTFCQIFHELKSFSNRPFLHVIFIKILLQTAHKQLPGGKIGNGIKLKRFEAMPIIHQLLCQHKNIQEYCDEHQQTRREASNSISKEVILLQESMQLNG